MKPSQDAINAVRSALERGFASDDLAKAGVTTATGLNAYDLRAAALLQIPVLTPLREKLGRTRRAFLARRQAPVQSSTLAAAVEVRPAVVLGHEFGPQPVGRSGAAGTPPVVRVERRAGTGSSANNACAVPLVP